jgi:metal-dependent HD superfamily phosphatase/phosphodiesterase
MSVERIVELVIGVTLGIIAAYSLMSIPGCASAQPARSTTYNVTVEAETITVSAEGDMTESGPRVVYIKGEDTHSLDGPGGAVDESQEAEGGEATVDLDATVPVQ